MAWTLVVNPGSSSKKYALYRDGVSQYAMKFERTALGFELCVEQGGTRQKCEGVSADTYGSALEHFVAVLVETELISSAHDISVVAVRVVVPGSAFQQHALITHAYLEKLRAHEVSAPLHIPHVIKEVIAVQTFLPEAAIVAASDSAFHSTIPTCARSYSLPLSDVTEHDLYRFGYHGLSVASIVRRHHSLLGQDARATVVCHIGSGVSVTAVKDEKSIFTTMGYAPGSGLMMATRAGDLDSGALLALMRAKNFRFQDAQMYLSTHGGLQGIADTADLRLVIERSARGDVASKLALDMYVYHIVQGIAQAVAALNGIRSLVFTATAGERCPLVRARICDRLTYLGLKLAADKNEVVVSKDGIVSTHDSVVKVAVMRTDEMGEMYLAARTVVDFTRA